MYSGKASGFAGYISTVRIRTVFPQSRESDRENIRRLRISKTQDVLPVFLAQLREFM